MNTIYFHKPSEPNGYLSNWHLSDFVVDGVKFTSAEQYIMYQKCVVFGDMVTAKKILQTDDVALIQDLGRRAANYVENVWAGMRQAVAVRGLYAKFMQNEELLEKLLGTGDALLVECARSDKNWSCGIALDDEDRKDWGKWTGLNILGFAMMEVRERIRLERAKK